MSLFNFLWKTTPQDELGKLGHDDMIEIARAYCEDQGYRIKKPSARNCGRYWEVITEGGRRPSPLVRIESRSGEVLEYIVLPR